MHNMKVIYTFTVYGDVLGEERKPVFSVENILFIILIPC